MGSGLHYLDDVARYINATDLRENKLSLTTQRIASWEKRGFFEIEKNEFNRNKRFIDFCALVTCRMITRLLKDGVDIKTIETYYKEHGGGLLFATQKAWDDYSHSNMRFKYGLAHNWEPLPGVLINSDVVSGTPCIKGTRIPTDMIYYMHHELGDSIKQLKSIYRLRTDQVQAAVDWEKTLKKYGTPKKKTSKSLLTIVPCSVIIRYIGQGTNTQKGVT